MTITRLSGGLTPADGADPRTFPAIWNPVADTIEALEAKNIVQFGTAVASAGDSLVFDGSQWVSGPRSGNAVINGDFGVWQRGTTFTPTTGKQYMADRWACLYGGGTPTTVSTTRESFTPADLVAVGYGDAEFFLRNTITDLGAATSLRIDHYIEDVRTFANQTITVSFWAKGSGTSPSIRPYLLQNFGSGGSTAVFTSPALGATALTGSWMRISYEFSVPSVSGKTIGSGSSLQLRIQGDSLTSGDVIDLWGVQLEAGSTATPFRLAGGGSKAAELALCQRYYYRNFPASANKAIGSGYSNTTTTARAVVRFPQAMRIIPAALEQTGTATDYEVQRQGTNTVICSAVPTYVTATENEGYVQFTVASGLSAGEGLVIRTSSVNGYVAWSAEL